MFELIVCCYALIVWLIFFKFKWLPWNIQTQVGTVALGLAGLAALVFTINVTSPQSDDVRVTQYVVEIVPRVTGRVIDVPIEGNTLIRRGEVLLRLDPEPYAQKLKESQAHLVEVESKVAQLRSDVDAARAQYDNLDAQRVFAATRLREAKTLAERDAGNRYDVENYAAQIGELDAQSRAAQANLTRARSALDATIGGVHSSVAQARAQVSSAQWELDQTVIRAPADGYAMNLQVRPGAFAAALPLRPVMSFVETTQNVVAFYDQNQLTKVEPGNEVELALKAKPGRIVHGVVDSIVWSTAQGQFNASGMLPSTAVEGAHPDAPLRYAVKIRVDADEADGLPMGARGESAIYTNHMTMLHMLRKVIIRVKTKINYLVFKIE
ncbi:HlyD family secretion protein [Pararobbsia silviterrae]|uniref:HlyD family secretion protein n=1 Tax=Pararobbsia silviterrae TaxID=1792498 RepID=A0A494YA17_9BURK|nr:HlyD family secretion protein [Pararobbsia silviterrae]RKP59226.1 HlyD family secretion protein [Pararobbsia silviterrae]